MPVFNMLLFTAREGLNLLHPRSLRQKEINQVPIFLGHLHILLHKMKKQEKNGLESELILNKLKHWNTLIVNENFKENRNIKSPHFNSNEFNVIIQLFLFH